MDNLVTISPMKCASQLSIKSRRKNSSAELEKKERASSLVDYRELN